MKKIRNNMELSGEVYLQFKNSRNPDLIERIIATCNASIKTGAHVRFYSDLELAVINERPDLVEYICERDINTAFALWNLAVLTPVKKECFRTGVYQNILNLLALNRAAGY